MEQFAILTEKQQNSLLQTLAREARCTVDEIKAKLAYTWEGWLARPTQFEPIGTWLYWLVMAGRGYGKTRIGAEWVRRQVKDYGRVALMGQDAGSVRAEMIEGESGILAVCSAYERPTHRPSKRQLEWPNGAISEIRTGEDPEGVRGLQCERLWADELAAWQYPQESWDMAMFGLRLGDDPRALITSTPKPIGIVRTLVNDEDCVITRGSTYENLDNLGGTYRKIISRYEGTRLGEQELHAVLLEDEGLAYRFSERLHVIQPFEIPNEWDRFEHMDYGLSAATAWYPVAVDHDGNLIVFDGHYEGGLPSVTAPLILQQRAASWEAVRNGKRVPNRTLADPAVFTPGKQTEWGKERAVSDMFAEHGVHLSKANNDRVLGFATISELLNAPDTRLFPEWHPRAGEPGAPRLYIFDVPGTLELREQLQDAPLEEDGKPHPGEAVDRDWERSKGHAHASLRYGVAGTNPKPSKRVTRADFLAPPPDPNELRREHFARAEKRRNDPATGRRWRNP